uniref:Uncharacterized protein n=1 Tax=Pararge aegeria TaxID=116150 RepID=S4P173_9NEOP
MSLHCSLRFVLKPAQVVQKKCVRCYIALITSISISNLNLLMYHNWVKNCSLVGETRYESRTGTLLQRWLAYIH